MNDYKIQEFLKVAEKLNTINITPLLIGSVGLEVVTKRDWNARDLDIHVPGNKRGWGAPAEKAIFDWKRIEAIMNSFEYRLIDLHEHEFFKKGLSIEFGIIDTLPSFAGVLVKDLEIHQYKGIKFYLLTLSQYLRVYEASYKDSYRAENNNYKDIHKIEYLKSLK